MDKVVYILGAGFSAPLGLPVMSNFRMKSQDMYFAHPDKYAYFSRVFDTIRQDLASVQGFYETDLYNIEEILSILEMNDYLEGRNLSQEFLDYISDVIEYYTPDLGPPEIGDVSNWPNFLFGKTWAPYGMFMSCLYNLVFSINADLYTTVRQNSVPEATYAIITLNYDVVPERICTHLNNSFDFSHRVGFTTSTDELDSAADTHEQKAIPLAKLHGSTETRIIVPPTWSKGINKEIVPAWKLAYRLLSEATHIRIVGYSLPASDAYIKYLLKASVINDFPLKRLDVICRDSSGTAKKRYDQFVRFPYYTFVSADVSSYLRQIVDAHIVSHRDPQTHRLPGRVRDRVTTAGSFSASYLEAAHRDFILQYTKSR